MRWQLGLMLGLLIAGWIDLSPDANLPQAQWQTPASVAIPPRPTSWPSLVAPTAVTVVAKIESAVSTGVVLELGKFNDLSVVEKLMTRLTAEKLRAYYTRHSAPEENTYRVCVGPYWSTMDAKADVRSWPTLLSGAQLMAFINSDQL